MHLNMLACVTIAVMLQDRAAQFRTIAASDKALAAKVAHMLNLNDLLYDRIGTSGVSLMRGMLDYNVDKRFTASHCLQHAFFANSTIATHTKVRHCRNELNPHINSTLCKILVIVYIYS
jgi:hypothetical protein